jgi:hypothetical protein
MLDLLRTLYYAETNGLWGGQYVTGITHSVYSQCRKFRPVTG